MAGFSLRDAVMVCARAMLAVLLLATGCASAPPTAPAAFSLPPLEGTAWLAADVDGVGIVDGAPTTLAFGANRRIDGRAGCNRYFGTFEQRGETVQIKPAGLTRMACPAAVMDQERKFLAVLESVTRGRRGGDALELLDGDGRVRMRLTAIPRQSARHGSTEERR